MTFINDIEVTETLWCFLFSVYLSDFYMATSTSIVIGMLPQIMHGYLIVFSTLLTIDITPKSCLHEGTGGVSR